MPENISGRPGVPGAGDSEEWIRGTLAEMRDTLAALTCAVADLAERIGDAEAEAEDILRRASTPAAARHVSPRRRRETYLRVVRALVIATAGAALLLAAACYSRPAAASPARSWRVAAIHDRDGDWDRAPATSR